MAEFPLDADQIRREAEEILSQPQYQPPPEGMLERFFNWIRDLLDGREPDVPTVPTGPAAQGSSLITYVIGALIVVALIGLAIWFLVKVMPRRRLRKKDRTSTRGEQGEEQISLGRAQWLRRAAEAEADGRFAAALHARYRALVVGLGERRELRLDDAVTSGEHRAEFPDRGPRAQLFDTATDQFEYGWYGEKPIDSADTAAFAELDAALLRGRPERARSGHDETRPDPTLQEQRR